MTQGMKPQTFQSTDANIFKVERDCASKKINIMIGEEEPAAKKESSSDDCNSNEDQAVT